jgi:hypothetical protein
MEGSLVAYKVFTNGSVLQASEINDNLMRQSVMVFSNAAARTAAITSPTEGMLTWLEDVNRYEFYNGSAWTQPFGTNLVKTTDFTSQTTVAFDNVFTSEFRNYEIIISVTNTATGGFTSQLRASGTPLTSNTYAIQYFDASAGSPFYARFGGQTNFNHGNLRNTTLRSLFKMTVSNPQVATANTNWMSFQYDTVISLNNVFGENNVIGSYDGIQFSVGAGAMSGNISIYGLRF